MSEKIITNINKNLYAFIFFAVTCLFIYKISLPGAMIAGSDEAFPLYNPQRTVTFFSSAWLERDLGLDNPFNFPRLTFYGFALILQDVGVHPWLTQSFIFFLLILSALFSVYTLTRYLIPGIKTVHIVAPIFYFYNIYTQSQVFSRLIYPLIFLWAFFPLFLYLWIRWIDTHEKKYLVYLLITSIIFSDAFGLVSSILTLWLPSVLYSAVRFFQSNFNIRVFIFSIVGFCLWFLVNIWWIYPVYRLQGNTYSSFLENNQAIETLKGVSVYFPNTSIFQLKQEYWFGLNGPWPTIYPTSATYTNVALVVFVVTCFGVFASKSVKNWWFIFFLALVSWFVIKGANPPFGLEFYEFLYSHLSVTQVLRNPYEKFGVVWVLSYAVFFALGVNYLSILFKPIIHLRRLLLLIFFLFTFTYLPRPMWDGSVFRKTNYVSIPEYYEEANTFLNLQGDGRLLHVPFLKDSLVLYKWNYIGEEPSEFLFDRTSISKSTHIEKLDEFYYLLHSSMYHKNFGHFLSVVNVEHIVLHKDVVLNSYYDENIEKTETFVSGWSDVEHVKTIGDLEIYKNKIENKRIYSVDKLEPAKNLTDLASHILQDNFDARTNGVYLSNEKNKFIENFSAFSSPNLQYSKRAADDYEVQVHNVSEPFILVLSNNFNKNWVARIDGEVVPTHFEVNGFANGWFIDKKGDYTIDVVFKVWPWE